MLKGAEQLTKRRRESRDHSAPESALPPLSDEPGSPGQEAAATSVGSPAQVADGIVGLVKQSESPINVADASLVLG